MFKRTINGELEAHLLRPKIMKYFTNTGKEKLPEDLPQDIKEPKAFLLRYGAIGDMVFVSPLPRLLKEQGYYVVLNTQPYGLPIMLNNPYIDEIWVQERGVISASKLGEYVGMLSKGFDRVINLSESLEATMLKIPNRPDYKEPRDKEALDKNYYDHTMELAGFPEAKGMKGELYFTEEEERQAKEFLEEYKDNFVVLIALSGSSTSKAYPWYQFLFVTDDIEPKPHYYGMYDEIKELVTITTGSEFDRLYEWNNAKNLRGAGRLSIRETCVLTKYVDLVIGPDTGFIHAAGCYNTPKICLLGQTTKNNLAKYWENDYSIQSPAKCSPCYNLVHDREQCPVNARTGAVECMHMITPDIVAKQIKAVYKQWKRDRFQNRIVTPQEHYNEVGRCQQQSLIL